MNSRTSNRRIKETTTKRETKPEEKQAKKNKQSIKDKQEPKRWIVYKVLATEGSAAYAIVPLFRLTLRRLKECPSYFTLFFF
jgi:hypothetical protein